MELINKEKKYIYTIAFVSMLIGFFVSIAIFKNDTIVLDKDLEVPEKEVIQTVIVNSDVGGTKDSEEIKININAATSRELSTLPGIAEGKANAITSYRKENGNFSNISELLNVSGIGNATYEKIKNKVVVE